MKTPRADAPSVHQKPHKLAQASRPTAQAACMGALGLLVAGCSGAQVRTDPQPEACPVGAFEAMDQLQVRNHDMRDDGTAEIQDRPFNDARKIEVTLQEGTARLSMEAGMGQLKSGTVLVGRFYFGKERVWGRFTEARLPGGPSYPVCLEAFDIGLPGGDEHGFAKRGLFVRSSNAPGTVNVHALIALCRVERFE